MMDNKILWICIGFLGQALFTARFVVQWLVSEKNKSSTIPLSFWYLSMAGGGILLLYACYKRDPVFILGQSLGLAVYFRNLYLIKKPHPIREIIKKTSLSGDTN